MRPDRFGMFTPRPPTKDETIADLRRRLEASGRSALEANREADRLRTSLADANGRLRSALFQVEQERFLRLQAERERDLASMENMELRKALEETEVLRGEVKRLMEEAATLRRRLDGGRPGRKPFGLSTPSSLDPLKENSSDESRARKGGAVQGHAPACYRPFTEAEADAVECEVLPPVGDGCCQGESLRLVRTLQDTVRRYVRGHFRKTLVTYGVFECTICGRTHFGPVRDVFPGMKHDFHYVAEVLKLAFADLLPYGQVARMMNINKGTLFNMMHSMALRLAPLYEEIKGEVRHQHCIHADETPWREDGHNGYTWLFTNDWLSLFLFRGTRASSVPLEVLGGDRLPLTLVTDRYSGYSPLNVRHQYCYVHLMRDMKKMAENDPASAEVRAFTDAMLCELKAAVALQGRKELDNAEYFREALAIQARIMDICHRDAIDGAVRGMQDFFREKRECLFQWVGDRTIPCHNNDAERGLRPVVVARKISMGCQGEKGMFTREVLSTVVQTAKARGKDVRDFLVAAMRRMMEAPKESLYPLLC